MIWLTWRQHRKQALFAAAGLAVIALYLIPTGLAMHHKFNGSGLAACLDKLGNAQFLPAGTQDCTVQAQQFADQYKAVDIVSSLFIFLPLLVGLFWGAPLVAREIEHGTHRLVWTQGVSRRHWALVKFGLIGGATLVVSAVYAFGLTWWMDPLRRATGGGRLTVGAFDVQGVAPIGYTLFAVGLGIFAGTVWRRALPSMAVTLVGFLVLRIALTVWARPRYLPALTLDYPLQDALQHNMARGDWVQSTGIRDGAGKLILANGQMSCRPGVSDCGQDLASGAHNWQLFQPGSRFWLFQGIETGIFVALAVLLLYFALQRIRRIA